MRPINRLPFARKTVTCVRSLRARLKNSFWMPPVSLSIGTSRARRPRRSILTRLPGHAVRSEPLPRRRYRRGQRRAILRRVEPTDPFLRAEPRALPLRVPARRELDCGARVRRIGAPADRRDDLPVADCFQRICGGREPGAEESAHLLDEARGKEPPHALAKPRREQRVLHGETELQRAIPLGGAPPGPVL